LGGKPLHWSDWKEMLELSLDLRRDLIKTEPFRKLAGLVAINTKILLLIFDPTQNFPNFL